VRAAADQGSGDQPRRRRSPGKKIWHDCHFSRKWQSCQIWHDGRMTTPPPGRREANKQATRAALRDAAARLFAEQGYEATTVAQIAGAARVGERTFYRYFDGKDDLLAEQALSWIDVLHQAIRDRPAQEGPYLAVARAMSAVAGQLAAEAATGGAWILTDLPRPVAVLRRATPAPLRRLERSIAEALLSRPAEPEPAAGAATARLRAQLVARAAVAVLRTAAGRHRELVREGERSPGVQELLRECFAELAEAASRGKGAPGGG
jgi:AcrR family transcriptional regulator